MLKDALWSVNEFRPRAGLPGSPRASGAQPDRQRADALAGRGEDGIGQGRNHATSSRKDCEAKQSALEPGARNAPVVTTVGIIDWL